MKGQTIMASVKDGEGNESKYPVTIDEVFVFKKGTTGLMIGQKGGYFFAVLADNADPNQQAPAALAAMATGFYWTCGADA